jgi:hypothetical protein
MMTVNLDVVVDSLVVFSGVFLVMPNLGIGVLLDFTK